MLGVDEGPAVANDRTLPVDHETHFQMLTNPRLHFLNRDTMEASSKRSGQFGQIHLKRRGGPQVGSGLVFVCRNECLCAVSFEQLVRADANLINRALLL